MIKTRFVFRGLCRNGIDPVFKRKVVIAVPRQRVGPISDKVAFHTSPKFKMFGQSSGSNIEGIAGGSDVERSSSESPSPKSDDDGECFFASSYTSRRRFSTIDDEAKVIALLKEILAMRETNISNWIIEVILTRCIDFELFSRN